MEHIGFKSKMDNKVKVLTYFTTSIIILATASLIWMFIMAQSNFWLLIIVFLFIAFWSYYFFQRITQINYIKNKKIVLKNLIGSQSIPIRDIKSIKKVRYSSVPMTYGSKGIFGFIGTTMDNHVSNVSNMSEMFSIETKNRKFLLSCQNSDELVSIIRKDMDM